MILTVLMLGLAFVDITFYPYFFDIGLRDLMRQAVLSIALLWGTLVSILVGAVVMRIITRK